MNYTKVIGIGWDVGGWMGTNHGIAVCSWDTASKKVSWHGTPFETGLPDSGILSLDKLLSGSEIDENLLADNDTLTVIGIDAPLGFPAEFINLLNGQPSQIVRPEKEIFNPLAYRAADQEIYERFRKKPLSASFDRIGNNATLAIAHARRWERENNFTVYPTKIEEADMNRIIIEVYPALVKSRRDGDAAEWMIKHIPGNVFPGTDAYDACICALYAIALGSDGQLLPKLKRPPEHLKDLVMQEGWIYYFDLENEGVS
ncbi:DUF429 domain-containing protein [Evansella clarkii]|uniref:DUF429 domain-containing protein n=1 Tax=Evansella clarkii TaxID=79879 RepID=UPI000B43B95A|nr:DUF429 domain-containing protein [Evansella clarkii]